MQKILKKLLFGFVICSVFATGVLTIQALGKVKMVNQENATTTSNNPVGWWKMDEGTGLTTADSSGNGNTGTLTNGPTWATGKLGNGLSFDGVNDYVNMGNVLNMTTNDFTVGAWIKTTMVAEGHIVSKGSNASGTLKRYILQTVLVSGTYRCGFSISDGDIRTIGSGVINVADGNWHYCVVVFDRDSTAKVYVDGKLDGTPVTLASQVDDLTNTTPFYIGRNATGSYFNGLIDDVRIYNRALSAGEVAQMYNSTKDGYLGKIIMKPSSTAKIKMRR
jgi:hypothetical protein